MLLIRGGAGFLNGGESGGRGEVAGGRGGRAGEALDEGHELVDGGVDHFGGDRVDHHRLVGLLRWLKLVELGCGSWVLAAEEVRVWRRLRDFVGLFAD